MDFAMVYHDVVGLVGGSTRGFAGPLSLRVFSFRINY